MPASQSLLIVFYERKRLKRQLASIQIRSHLYAHSHSHCGTLSCIDVKGLFVYALAGNVLFQSNSQWNNCNQHICMDRASNTQTPDLFTLLRYAYSQICLLLLVLSVRITLCYTSVFNNLFSHCLFMGAVQVCTIWNTSK